MEIGSVCDEGGGGGDRDLVVVLNRLVARKPRLGGVENAAILGQASTDPSAGLFYC